MRNCVGQGAGPQRTPLSPRVSPQLQWTNQGFPFGKVFYRRCIFAGAVHTNADAHLHGWRLAGGMARAWSVCSCHVSGWLKSLKSHGNGPNVRSLCLGP